MFDYTVHTIEIPTREQTLTSLKKSKIGKRGMRKVWYLYFFHIHTWYMYISNWSYEY